MKKYTDEQIDALMGNLESMGLTNKALCERLLKYDKALKSARDTLLLMSLLDKTNTCDKEIGSIDAVLKIKDHKTSISLQK